MNRPAQRHRKTLHEGAPTISRHPDTIESISLSRLMTSALVLAGSNPTETTASGHGHSVAERIAKFQHVGWVTKALH